LIVSKVYQQQKVPLENMKNAKKEKSYGKYQRRLMELGISGMDKERVMESSFV
jgi:hypothetical protein